MAGLLAFLGVDQAPTATRDNVEKISASSSYGGNPMACAAPLASIEVIEEENLCQRSAHLGEKIIRYYLLSAHRRTFRFMIERGIDKIFSCNGLR